MCRLCEHADHEQHREIALSDYLRIINAKSYQCECHLDDIFSSLNRAEEEVVDHIEEVSKELVAHCNSLSASVKRHFNACRQWVKQTQTKVVSERITAQTISQENIAARIAECFQAFTRNVTAYQDWFDARTQPSIDLQNEMAEQVQGMLYQAEEASGQAENLIAKARKALKTPQPDCTESLAQALNKMEEECNKPPEGQDIPGNQHPDQ